MRPTPSLIAAALLASPAAAVTPEEVWTMFADVIAATGAEVTAAQTRDGDTLTVSDVAVTWRFPFDAGEIDMRLGPYTLTEEGDGSVAFTAPEQSIAFLIRFAIEGEEVMASGTLRLSQPGAMARATGSADDITLTGASPETRIDLRGLDLQVPDAGDVDLSEMAFSVTATDTAATTRYVREADLFRLTSEATGGPGAFRMSLPVEGGGLSESTGGSETTAYAVSVALPRTPMSVMNLAAAIRDGLTVTAQTATTGQRSRSVTTLGGQVVSDQTTVTGSQETSLNLGPEGLLGHVGAEDITFDLAMPEMLPLPIAARIAEAAALVRIPVLASPETAAPADYDISLTGLTVDEQVWGLFDPAGFIPRDPVDLTLDLGADLRPLVDLLDIPTMIATIEAGETPVELDAVRIDALALRGAGVEVEGSGAFTLDFDDMTTFPGAPRPEGSATVRIAGANALIDTLIEMGLLDRESAMGARMGLGMFTRPVADDAVESAVEVTPEGHVIVNGQRMR